MKEWVIRNTALEGNGGMMADCRRYWIADLKIKIVDPRDYLLVAFENVYLGLRNANGKIILAPIWYSIDMGSDFHIVATKHNDLGTTCDLSIFDATGKLLATVGDIGPATGGVIGVLIYPTKLESCMII